MKGVAVRKRRVETLRRIRFRLLARRERLAMKERAGIATPADLRDADTVASVLSAIDLYAPGTRRAA